MFQIDHSYAANSLTNAATLHLDSTKSQEAKDATSDPDSQVTLKPNDNHTIPTVDHLDKLLSRLTTCPSRRKVKICCLSNNVCSLLVLEENRRYAATQTTACHCLYEKKREDMPLLKQQLVTDCTRRKVKICRFSNKV